MKCIICKKTCEEVDLYEGVLEDEMVMVCNLCAEKEGIPVIKKPTNEQLNQAEKRYSVRERMERLSGMRDATEISQDQTVLQKNLSRLRPPKKKQTNKEVFEDYDWKVKIERRRRKMTISQLAKAIGVDFKIIQEIEQGQIPADFKEVFNKLESFLRIKLLKYHEEKFSIRNPAEEEKIINEVKRKMGISVKEESNEDKSEKIIEDKKKIEKLDKIYKGEADFSRREDLTNVTLNDLVRLKKEREIKEREKQERARESELIGDEIDLEE